MICKNQYEKACSLLDEYYYQYDRVYKVLMDGEDKDFIPEPAAITSILNIVLEGEGFPEIDLFELQEIVNKSETKRKN
ncbi:MAG: hypothetical protein LBS10_00105 [Gracilibacteraceae bacterium]|jgi:hypothetical protein|nr:hypothetical protein [Gracilibacteraceae bacterium]